MTYRSALVRVILRILRSRMIWPRLTIETRHEIDLLAKTYHIYQTEKIMKDTDYPTSWWICMGLIAAAAAIILMITP